MQKLLTKELRKKLPPLYSQALILIFIATASGLSATRCAES